MQFKHGAYYYVTSTTPRRWIRLHHDLAKARVLWAQLENEGCGASGDLFCTLLDQWLARPEFLELSKATQVAYENISRQLRDVFDGVAIAGIKPPDVARWLDEHPSKARANLGRAVMSNVFDMAVRRGIVETNPCREIGRNIIKPRDRHLTDEEFLAIRDQAHPIVRAAMDLSYLTGARISDVLKITFADIRDDGLYVIQGKTNKKQRFGMTPALKAAIETAKGLPRPVRGLHLFCTRAGQPYAYGTVNELWREAYKAAGVKDVRFHDIRAKAATDAKRLGMDYQSLLGHTSKAMSDRYVRLREFEDVAPLPRIVDKL